MKIWTLRYFRHNYTAISLCERGSIKIPELPSIKIFELELCTCYCEIVEKAVFHSDNMTKLISHFQH